MATKKVNTRVMNKCDLDENWRLATNFTPKKGELIIYQNCAEPASSTNYVTGNTKFKIGDGTTKVGDLPFQAGDANSYEVITLTSASGTLTQEVYDKITSSPFNQIKLNNRIYILQQENNTSYIYASSELTTGRQITITKSDRKISYTSLGQYVAYNYIGAKDTNANGSTENGNTYLKLYENNVKRSQFNIKGTGATTVTSDASGNITITSTDTHVTSVDNHYTPTANSTSEISKDASSSTEATWGTTSLVTGVNIQRDAKGHVTGMTLDSIKMPAKPEGGSSRPKITLSTQDAQSYTSHYGRTYYLWHYTTALATAIAAGEYDVTIYDQTSGGGHFHCPLTGPEMTWIGESIPNGSAQTEPSQLTAWAFKAKENNTDVSFWCDKWDRQTHISLDDGTL